MGLFYTAPEPTRGTRQANAHPNANAVSRFISNVDGQVFDVAAEQRRAGYPRQSSRESGARFHRSSGQLISVRSRKRAVRGSVEFRPPDAPANKTRSSAVAEGSRDASCQLKYCQLPSNSAENTCTTSPEPSISCR